MASIKQHPKESKLSLKQILQWLKDDGMINAQDYKNCEQYGLIQSRHRSKHPLNVMVDCETKDQSQFGKLLTLEYLTQWLAKKVSLPYYYIMLL